QYFATSIQDALPISLEDARPCALIAVTEVTPRVTAPAAPLSGTRFGDRHVLEAQRLGPAGLMDDDRSHCTPPPLAPPRPGPARGHHPPRLPHPGAGGEIQTSNPSSEPSNPPSFEVPPPRAPGRARGSPPPTPAPLGPRRRARL